MLNLKLPIEKCPSCNSELDKSIFGNEVTLGCSTPSTCKRTYVGSVFNYKYHVSKDEIFHFHYVFFKNNECYTLTKYIREPELELSHCHNYEFITLYKNKNMIIPSENTMNFVESYIDKIFKLKSFL